MRAPRAGVAAGLVVVLALAALVLVLDQRRLAEERAAVAACTRGAVAAEEVADARLSATATYAAPAPAASDGEDSIADTLLADAAERVVPGLVAATRDCEAVDVRPWHPGTASARDNVVTYLLARTGALQEVAAGERDYGAPDPALDRLRERAFPPQG